MHEIIPIRNVLRSKMDYWGLTNKDILSELKDPRGKTRSGSYLTARLNGRKSFTASELRLMKRKLQITTKDDFLETFFPGEKWEDESACTTK